MNFVCSNCSTKYSLADERVADGVYHTPCKRCGATMVIRKQAHGESGAPSRPATLRSQRSEDSLLFSLGNLASTADRLTPIAGPESEDRVRAEDSGLLDIRRMAASYQGEGQARPSASSSDLFVPMAAPVPLLLDPPVTAGRTGKKGPLWWLVGGATGMAAATLVLAVMVFKGDLSGNDAQASTNKPVVASEPASPTLIATAPPADVEPTTIVAPAEPEPAAPATVTEAAKPEVESKPRPRERARTRPRREREQRTTVEREEKPAEPETAPPKKGCLDEVACLLASDPPACCRKYTTTRPEPEATDKPDTRLPAKLDRSAIKTSMNKTLARVTACGSRSPASGKVTVSVKVAGDGSVARVTVKEAPDAALGQCVARAVEKATFPETQKGGSFSYPFLF